MADLQKSEYLTALENAREEPDIRNILKNATRDYNLSQSAREEILGFGRSKLRKIAGQEPIAEKGAGAPVSTQGVPSENAPAPSKALGTALHEVIQVHAELEEVGGKPVHLTVREPALPVIDAASLGVAMKMWQQLARVIEENTPDCLTKIGTTQYRNSEFWRAARLAYGIDRPTVEAQSLDYAQGRALVTVRVNMGRRWASATGIAERAEKGKENAPMNTLQALAWTRAANRASREVIGLGSKSAEEVDADG